jgi:hypothetical membrane protein
MKKINISKFFIVQLPRISMLVFIVFVLLSMYLYKGGVYHMVLENGVSNCPGANCNDDGHWTTGYLFFKNFLSDLGRTKTHSGDLNFHSSLLFNMALTFAGITYILFYSFLKNLFPNQLLAKLGAVFGVCGAISFIGVAFTPADEYLPMHIVANEWIFRFFLISTIIYSWLIYKNDLIDNKYLIGNMIFILSLAAYILILIYGPKPYEPGGLEFQAVSQKLIMLNFLFSIVTQTMAYDKIIN